MLNNLQLNKILHLLALSYYNYIHCKKQVKCGNIQKTRKKTR